ncbi:MAG TPA: HNH endonuclease family protein, partial [Pirellulales bacterium]|nr:HNH endonuclease family protein [Pirellulales bacterium]
DAWRAHLGDDADAVYEQLLHTLGNLTLTGYNVPMSNNGFAEKQAILADSHVELNKYFQAIAIWNGDAIGARAEHLAEIALEVWPYFGDGDEGSTQRDGVTNRKPAAILFFGERMPAATWRDVAQRTLEAIADRDGDAFELVAKQFPRFVANDCALLRDGRQLANGMFMEVHLSAKALYTVCVQVTEAAGISSEDWRVEFA